MDTPFLLFKAHLFNQPLSRIEEVLRKTEPTLELTHKIVKTRRKFISLGEQDKQKFDVQIPLGVNFYLHSNEPLSGWICLIAASRTEKQLLLPNNSTLIFNLKNEKLIYPKEHPFLMLNNEDIYTFIVIEISSWTAPPIITPPTLVQPINPTEEQALANILDDVKFQWGFLSVLAS